MKIAGCVFRKKAIHENTEKTFCASYKRKTIYVSSDHGFGEPEFSHLTRYYIEVSNNDGLLDVDTWEDCHTMRDAIRKALEGACLIEAQN